MPKETFWGISALLHFTLGILRCPAELCGVCHSCPAVLVGVQVSSRASGSLNSTHNPLSPRPHLQAKVTEECSQYEFENYMRQQLLLAEEKSSVHEARSWVPKRQFGSVPPVRRLGHDAQPMNPLDAAILAQRYLRK